METMDSKEKLIGKIMEDFPFEKACAMMQLLGFKWYDGEEYRQATVEHCKEVAHELLVDGAMHMDDDTLYGCSCWYFEVWVYPGEKSMELTFVPFSSLHFLNAGKQKVCADDAQKGFLSKK